MITITKWLATFLITLGTALSSFNMYPHGPIVLLLAGILWGVVSISWREWSLLVTNIATVTAGIAGLAWVYLIQ